MFLCCFLLCTKLKTKRYCYIRLTLSGFLKCCTIDSTCITFDFKLTGISLTGVISFFGLILNERLTKIIESLKIV